MRKVLYIDMDNVLVDFPSAFPHVDPGLLIKHATDKDNIPGIFGRMAAMPGAIAAFDELASIFDTYILSTSPWDNPSAWSDKLLWVKRHLGQTAYKRLILTHHKNLNNGHFLVDDRSKNGADRFAGELVLFGSDRFPDWSSVLSYLRPRAA